MTAQKSELSLKLLGCALVAAAIAFTSASASAQNRNGFNITITRGTGFNGPQFNGPRFNGPRFNGPGFNQPGRSGPFADMPRGPRRVVRWLADKPPRWHVRMSREFPRRYDSRVKPHLRSLPQPWQVRVHNRFSNWYHNNIAPGHRLVGGGRGRGHDGQGGRGGGGRDQIHGHGGNLVYNDDRPHNTGRGNGRGSGPARAQAQPDLAVTNLRCVNTYQLVFTVKNFGNGPSGSYRIRVGNPDAGDVPNIGNSRASLDSGQARNITVNLGNRRRAPYAAIVNLDEFTSDANPANNRRDLHCGG